MANEWVKVVNKKPNLLTFFIKFVMLNNTYERYFRPKVL